MKKIILLLLLILPVVIFADIGEIRIVSAYDTDVASDSFDAVVKLGDTFTLQIWVNPNSVRVNAVSVFLTYDSTALLLLDTADEQAEPGATEVIREYTTIFGDIFENRFPLQGKINYSALTNDDYFAEETLIAEMVFLAYGTAEETLISYEFIEDQNRETALVTYDSHISIISETSVTPGRIMIVEPIPPVSDPVSGEVYEYQQRLFKPIANIIKTKINDNQNLEIFCPSGIFDNDDTMIIRNIYDSISDLEFRSVGKIINAVLDSGQDSFTEPLNWTFRINEEISAIENLTVRYSNLNYLSSNPDDWHIIEPVYFNQNEILEITFSIDHLTFFGVFDTSLALPENYANIRVYPNPYVPASNGNQGRHFIAGNYQTGVIFDNITVSSKIYIYTITGQLVTESQPLPAGRNKFHWNARNNNDRDVASGIYIYVIKDGNGNVKTGKLGIVR